MIHGPSAGYDNGPKWLYRRQVYRFVEDALGGKSKWHVPRNKRKVLLLDESEGLETFYLIERGYRPENLHVVNYSAAKMAVLQSRVRAATNGRSINTYGCDLKKALARIPDDVSFDVIHLDSTWKVTDERCWLIRSASSCVTKHGGAVIVVNVQKGRELPEDMPASTDLGWEGNVLLRNFERIMRITHSMAFSCTEKVFLRCGFTDIRYEEYTSGKVPMLWVAVQVAGQLDVQFGSTDEDISESRMRDPRTWNALLAQISRRINAGEHRASVA